MIGADNLLEFHAWKEPEKLVQLCQLVVLTRPGYDPFIPKAIGQAKIIFLPVSPIGISSTTIRTLVARKESIKYLVTEAVERYIGKKKLYVPANRKGRTIE